MRLSKTGFAGRGVFSTALVAGLAMAMSPVAAPLDLAPTVLPLHRAITVAGIDVACTGVGQTRDDPQWNAYGVRIEFSNGLNEYLGDGAIRLRNSAGALLLEVTCDAPWVLLRLPAGHYSVVGWVPGSSAKPRSAPISPPRTGQTRFVLQFPDA
jgi:hypothetical protein